MKTVEQVLEEAQANLQQSEQLITEALGKVAQTDQYFQSFGVERAGASRLMEGNLLNDTEKQKVRTELAEWMQEVETEIQHQVDQQKAASSTSSAKPLRRGIRI